MLYLWRMPAVLKYGFISDIDPEKGLVVVTFPEDDDNEQEVALVSDWMQVSVPKTKGDKHTFPYDIGELVWCVMEDETCEEGVVGGSIYSEDELPVGAGENIHRVTYSDGGFYEYDRDGGDMTFRAEGNIYLDAPGGGKKIIHNGGPNGGIPISQSVADEVNEIKDDLNALKLVMLTTWVPASGDGGAALKLAAATWAGQPFTPTLETDIANPDVEH